mmetsp:Transcript_10136/g.21280  ORF Transcript_10136/g.21280 Transcript_10136/m.21280 type:complete len:293 (+) Transcript_10136:267-1145(+)|eukprot:CAMPEP_0171337170 /NCGR_PEP_ID=MMETSP0878-20121228/6525_1 /TAXON_ID=67004 /ORGANISM="Thalassiosira weissflogii, Strain CCMP1336" /LENGTH=292 /DNA_ID=CAMNT_0011838767 /DNA_START=114 /DNA_END=992 /DNA_ORIENTATION=+
MTKHAFFRAVISFLFNLITLYSGLHQKISSTNALQIVPPSSNDDWRDLASLLVETFDEPTIITPSPSSSSTAANPLKNKLQITKWNMFEKSLTEQFAYNQYVRTARKMKGKKYAILIAKEYNPGSEENEFRAFYEVVGMAEIGLNLEPSTVVSEESDVGDATNNNIISAITTASFSALVPRATVGVLCVKSSRRKMGIGQKLLQKCEEIIVESWGEDEIVVEVEPKNRAALEFFRSSGYHYGGKADFARRVEEIDAEVRNATVRKLRTFEERPHLVLRKSVARVENDNRNSR